MNLTDYLDKLPPNKTIVDNFILAWSKINNPKYKKILCSLSGGSDSDVMLDICHKCDIDKKIDYVWFDVGLDFQATKEHLEFLEKKYNIEIIRLKTKKPIPIACKQYGQPFLDKHVSEMIGRLQKHNFEFEDLPYEELLKKYCTWREDKQDWYGCKTALMWWCNKNTNKDLYNIRKRPWLKEFLIENKPEFLISCKCCNYAKKDLVKDFIITNNYDLNMYGIRKAEGGVRANIKSCFTEDGIHGADEYRPVFWYSNADKKEYIEHFNIELSDCYTKYGMVRTGCCGCPYAGKNLEDEKAIILKFEPKLSKACNTVFGASYTFTDKYKEYVKEHNKKYGNYQAWVEKDIDIL